ncbi:hemerythrin domain-containing protein [Burkholderia cenocepacia]|uniref:hemerythrin domain-containing protein n=1 Tax=Burkholderia cenocepacia TaxID=95486 RepID=UPI00073A55BE|nr:hemerythrin domain-containing protein [Burkholderia cenocepacia]ALV55565.1 universal stress protein [Burkholderia cenocepacia]AQQ20377.1 universal stress protein [Burkholderia cenocepacia]AQQ49908.1 universal stress protein [Burkholderia cenocepacia]MBR8260317.1 hemerythrin domain-containing protein [Burkholderia cenocepacia]MBR8370078.1 hemerythrin domain-containing protein [Burkholderia cenocepacia]
MYRHLLVTVDDAPGGIDAIGDALELARAVGARVTFVLPAAAPDSRLSGARLPGHGAKVEAAARAQGLSHGIAGAGHPGAGQPGAGDASPGVLAGKLGCDLIGVAALPPDADAAARAQRRQLLATSGVPVLVCPSRRAPAAARVIARCLDAHRMAGGLLHALAALGDATNEPHRQAADARRALAALAALQNARFGTATEARLFAALRVRAECVAAELDELDRQRQRDTHALGALARLAEDGLPSAAFDAALARYAHGAFEQMGRIEGVIFPAARRYLGDADWTGLDEPPADNAPATPPDTNEPADARRASD